MTKGKVKTVSTGYQPRPLQLEIHKNRKRNNVLAIHRRFGKTVLAVNELIDSALQCTLHKPQFAYIAPFYKQAKTIAWAYLKDFTHSIPGTRHMETELKVILPNGATIQLFGGDNYDALRGIYLDGVVLDEYGNMAPSIWTEVLRPALSDRKGWAVFLGTPNGKNHFYNVYRDNQENPDWYCATFRADETGIIDADELEAMRREMGETEYRQEMLCDWAAAVKGSFYAHEMGRCREEGRITNVPHASTLPVHLSFDLGLDDSTAVWFVQCVRSEIRLIDYREWTDLGLLDILAELRSLPYIYGDLYMPHDIKVRELTSGRSRLETVEELGFTVIVTPQVSIADGIQASRAVLSQCWFDKHKCARGIDCMENYRKKHDRRTDTFLENPVHDEYSHGADSFRYLALNYSERLGDLTQSISGPSRLSSFGRRGSMPRVRRSV